VLRVRIGHWTFDDGGDDASENIAYCISHFDIPDPGSVETRHPEEIAACETLCQVVLDEFLDNSREWEKDNPQAMPYSHRPFQKRDIARLLFKGSGLLSWEQGLGKTLGGALFAETAVRHHGAQDARLFVTAKDLVPQWQRELKRFYGVEATVIAPKKAWYWGEDKDGKRVKKTYMGIHGQAKEIARHLKQGGTGIYITYYEALTLVGTGRSKAMPTVVVREDPVSPKLIQGTGRYGYYYWTDEDSENTGMYAEDGSIREQTPVGNNFSAEAQEAKARGVRIWHGYIHEKYGPAGTKKITSKTICPQCQTDLRNGWNGLYCDDGDGGCGYAHFESRVKPVASILSGAFKKGVIVLDEITMIQGDDAKRSKAMRGLRARHKLGMTGTPIKNFIAQAFWLLWWCLGDSTTRFGYSYDTGRTKFESDFSVIEWVDKGGKRENRKALPEVTNLSMLWRLLSSSIIRRRKEETGEPIVPKYYHEIAVPLGIAQIDQMNKWMKDFHRFFAEKYPDKKVVKSGMHEIMAPMLGLNWKLDFACTAPLADPDYEWTGIEGVSNFTPANLRVVELAMALAKEGRKVLIGSNLLATGKWIADQLCEKGVNAVHILDESGQTANPDARAKRVHSFQTDEVQVFCAGVNAMRLGHNLDQANAVIMHGLDWSFDTNDQFIARVHRLTSKQPVDVFNVLPTLENQETITTRKHQNLDSKEAAAALALDGRLVEKMEDRIDVGQIMAELVERGITVTEEAVDEVSVQEMWEALAPFESYEAPAGLVPDRSEAKEVTFGQDLLNELEGELEQEAAFIGPKPMPADWEPEEVEVDPYAFLDEVEAEMVELETMADTVEEDVVPVAAEVEQIAAEMPAIGIEELLDGVAHSHPDDEPGAWEACETQTEVNELPDSDPPTAEIVAPATKSPDPSPEAEIAPDVAALMQQMVEQMAAQTAAMAEMKAEIERLKNDEQLTLDVG
jgi:hypothetical protein